MVVFYFFLKFFVVFHFFFKFLFFYYEKVSPRIYQGAKKAPRLGLQATIIKRINTYQSRRRMKKITEKNYSIGKEGSLQGNDNDNERC